MFRRSFLKVATAAPVAKIGASRFFSETGNGPSKPVETIPCPEAFAIESGYDYFNTGGLGPTLKEAITKQLDTIVQIQPRVDRGHKQIEDARPEFAKFLGCSETEIAFTRNATEGNSTIASGLKLKPGDEVIIDSHAHQGGSVPWMTRQLYEKVVVKSFEPDPHSVQGNLDRIAKLITPRTKVISVSHITAPTGIRLPVNEIAKVASDRKLWFHIDGAQSVGMVPVDVNDIGCDSYAVCGHKWLCGPIGTGFLFLKESRMNDVRPTEVGDYAAEQWRVPSQLGIRLTATRFESGTRDPASILGMLEAIKFQLQAGREKIASHSLSLARNLREQLLAMPKIEVVSPLIDPLDSAIVSFRVKGQNFSTTFSKLYRQKFRCRPVNEQDINATRVSTHYFNTQEQCDRLLEAIKSL